MINNLKYYLKEYLPSDSLDIKDDVLTSSEFVIFPGFLDVHVHLREPGFAYKETIKTGSLAAAHGGYTDVCTMPNLKPVPDNLENLLIQKNIIDKDAVINIHPYGSITINQQGNKLAAMEEMAPYVIAFSDDGKGVQDEAMMKEAMLKAKSLNKIIVAHCEDSSLINGGYIHAGSYALKNNHRGIVSESEWKEVERDIKLAKETKCSFHVCHVSTKESVALIRQAKKEHIDITAETAPHYLLLDENDLKEDGFFKMNPPLRSKEDKEALIAGLLDGTIEMIATDHAPHAFAEKNKGLKDSAFGIVGLEIAFPLLYTYLVKKQIITLDKLLELLCVNPRKRFNIKPSGYSIWDLNKKYLIDADDFLSKGKATPFINTEVYGECLLTSLNGKIIYQKGKHYE